MLPAGRFRLGSAPSGFFTGITSPIAAPFPGQLVQGFSAVHRNADGNYLANSPDFELLVLRITPVVSASVTATR